MSADEPPSAKALYVRPRQLNATGTIHDQELVRDHPARLLQPARLGARAAVTDLDHAVGVALDAGIVRDYDRGRAGFPKQLSKILKHPVPTRPPAPPPPLARP